jgi:tryptophan-rich sensory protein
MTGLAVVPLRRHAAVLAACLAIAMLPGFVGAAYPPTSWYDDLVRSSLTPPGWVFPIVWTSLYLAIGVSLFAFLLVTDERERRVPLVLFGIQLVLNAAWSPLFFGAHAVGAALIEMIALWLAIAATAIAFGRHSRFAAWLLAPYLVWVGFATYLTLVIWRAN